jgi:hypothetical protein
MSNYTVQISAEYAYYKYKVYLNEPVIVTTASSNEKILGGLLRVALPSFKRLQEAKQDFKAYTSKIKHVNSNTTPEQDMNFLRIFSRMAACQIEFNKIKRAFEIESIQFASSSK